MDYKKIFVIKRQFDKQQIPDDIAQLLFEYIGDLDETATQLQTKHAYSYVKFYFTGFNDRTFLKTFGSYCCYCNKLYLLTSKKQLVNHSKSQSHLCNINNRPHHPSKRELGLMLEKKAYFMSYDQIQEAKSNLFLEKINLDNI